MKTKRYRTPNKKNYLTYDELEQLGFGSWLKDNAGNLVQTVGGGAMVALGAGLAGVTAGLGSPAGAALASSGVGMMSSGARGFANTATQNKQEEAAEVAMKNQQEILKQQNKLKVAEAPIAHVATMKCGGRLKKRESGGNLGIPLIDYTFDPVSIVRKRPVKKVLPTPPAKIEPRELDTLQDYKVYNQEFATLNSPSGKYHDFSIRRINNEGQPFYENKRIPENELSQFIANNQDAIKRNPNYSYLVKKAAGGTINYNGQPHTGPDGGVPVDGMGNPNMQNPVALVEEGEVSFNDGESTYVFSDSLELEKKKSFAKRAKEIQKKYKMRMADGRIIDPIAKTGYDKEMKELVDMQEAHRTMEGLGNGEYEGLPIGENGIRIKPIKSAVLPVKSVADLAPTAMQAQKDLGTYQPTTGNFSKEYSPYEGMSGWEAAIPASVSALSNLLGYKNVKDRSLPKMNLPPVVARRISLEQERQNLREQGALARTMNRRGLAESGASQAQLMSGTTAGNIGVQRNLNEGLVQLGTTEALTNLQSQQRADEINSQQAMQEQAFNSQLELGKQSQMDQYLMNAMTAPMLGMQDYLRSRQETAKIQSSQPNRELVWEYDPNKSWLKRKVLRSRERGTDNILDTYKYTKP